MGYQDQTFLPSSVDRGGVLVGVIHEPLLAFDTERRIFHTSEEGAV